MTKNNEFRNYIVVFIFLVSLMLRAVMSYLYYGYPNDIACFKSWSDMLFSEGLSKFYSSPQFTDYPPGYMYILYILGFVRHVFNIPIDSQVFTFIIKLPAVIFDIALGFFIYIYTENRTNYRFATFVVAMYLFNPAVIINSAIWGQVDAVYTFLIIVSVFCLTHELLFRGFLLFTCAILIKPQALIFSPVYLFYLFNMLHRNNFGKDTIFYILKSGAVCICVLFLAILPFTENLNFFPIIEQYVKTLASYPYASVNAYNLYSAIGANWLPVDDTFLFMSYSSWGFLFIVLIVIASLYMLQRNCDFFFTAALINFGTFMLSVKMHERYVFPSIALFLISFTKKKRIPLLIIYTTLSITLFVNCKDVLFLVANNNDLDLINHSLRITSIANITLFVFTVILAVMEIKTSSKRENIMEL